MRLPLYKGGVSKLWPTKRRSVKLYLYLVLVFFAVVFVSLFWMFFMKIEILRSSRVRGTPQLTLDESRLRGPEPRTLTITENHRIPARKDVEKAKHVVERKTVARHSTSRYVKPNKARGNGGHEVKESTVRLPPVGQRYKYETEQVLSLSVPKAIYKPANIAIGCAITSRGLSSETLDGSQSDGWHAAVRQLPLFHQLLPSFCQTASVGYRYRFYFAYDFDDPWLSIKDARRAFADVFLDAVDTECHLEGEQITVDLKFTSCNHSGAPAWAQNDAMMEAYNDDVRMQYFYRVNDDTVLMTPSWTEAYIQVLNQFEPPNIGVVGPNFKTNGTSNSKILTYDFVHRIHIDIFGFYYPRELKDWYADDWITHVHQPRSVRVKDIAVMHTKVLKTRYKKNVDRFKLLDGLISRGRIKISAWTSSRGDKSKKSQKPS